MSELPNWPYAHGRPVSHARIRSVPEDFRVDEILGFVADGEGEHLLLQVEKRGANTAWVARQLARIAGLRTRDVSYAGRKDRNAVTVQHFTVWLGKRPEPDWTAIDDSEFRILSVQRHRRKLRLGALQGNRFRLIVRELAGPTSALEERLQAIRDRGVPNYFGEQRFGRDGGNIKRALAFFSDPRRVRDRDTRSLLLSTARSLIFNAVLAQRVQQGTWNAVLPGEACMLDGSRSVFCAHEVDAALQARVAEGDVHPSGPLWGKGVSLVDLRVAELEKEVAEQYAVWARGLETAGLQLARRALRLPVQELCWTFPDDKTLSLEFVLPAGAYATAVLREIIIANTTSEGAGDDVEQD